MVDRYEAKERAEYLLMDFELDGWTVVLTNAPRTAGWCQPRKRRIGLSGPIAELNDWDEVEDTIRHEIAHALAPITAWHGPEWVAMCQITGAKPVACKDYETVEKRWILTCETCGTQWKRHATRRGLIHGECRDRETGLGGVLIKTENPDYMIQKEGVAA